MDDDEATLADLRATAAEALRLVQAVSADRFARDRMRQLAVERLIEILGEAANRLSDRTRRAIPHDWDGLNAMRNLLAHQYDHVDPAVVRRVVERRLPDLLRVLDK